MRLDPLRVRVPRRARHHLPSEASVKTFASRLRAAREARGLTQLDLAAQTGIAQTALSHYETWRREPNLRNLRILAEALDVSTDYLTGHEGIGARIAMHARALKNCFDEDGNLARDHRRSLANLRDEFRAISRRVP